jgi:hypothetical protein
MMLTTRKKPNQVRSLLLNVITITALIECYYSTPPQLEPSCLNHYELKYRSLCLNHYIWPITIKTLRLNHYTEPEDIWSTYILNHIRTAFFSALHVISPLYASCTPAYRRSPMCTCHPILTYPYIRRLLPIRAFLPYVCMWFVRGPRATPRATMIVTITIEYCVPCHNHTTLRHLTSCPLLTRYPRNHHQDNTHNNTPAFTLDLCAHNNTLESYRIHSIVHNNTHSLLTPALTLDHTLESHRIHSIDHHTPVSLHSFLTHNSEPKIPSP